MTTSTILADLQAAANLSSDLLGTLDEVVYEGGFVAAGQVSDLLDDVVEAAGGRWSIQDGVIQIIGADAPSSGGGVLLKPGTGLIGSPERKDDGIQVKSLLRPELRPGRLFKIESRFISGWYRVEKSTHTASSDGLKWMTAIEAETP